MTKDSLEENNYIRIGAEGKSAMVGVQLNGFRDILFMGENGNDYDHSFDILSKILGDIFPNEQLRRLKDIVKDQMRDADLFKIKVSKASANNKGYAMFESRGRLLLLKRKSATEEIREWIRRVPTSI